MDSGWRNKVALITGACSRLGFGKAKVVTLAGKGCNLIVTDRYLEWVTSPPRRSGL